MRKLLVFGAVLVVVGCGQAPAGNPQTDKAEKAPAAEARYKGRTVSQWARQLRDKDAATRTEAAEALKAIGPDAKSAVGEIKLALKERAWELLITHLGTSANATFATVGTTIGGTAPPREPTKDEIIADLRRQLEQKQREIDRHRRQMDAIGNDPCLRALALALVAIDPREIEAMAPGAVQSQKTFNKVSDKIGSTSPR
jgi:hypothetical protein